MREQRKWFSAYGRMVGKIFFCFPNTRALLTPLVRSWILIGEVWGSTPTSSTIYSCMCICGLSSHFGGLSFLGVPGFLLTLVGFLPTSVGFLPGCTGLYKILKKKKKKKKEGPSHWSWGTKRKKTRALHQPRIYKMQKCPHVGISIDCWRVKRGPWDILLPSLREYSVLTKMQPLDFISL